MQSAADELMELDPDGLQLTPGCVPTEGFLAYLMSKNIYSHTHHGFTPHALRQPVWKWTELLVTSDSVHPPKYKPDGVGWYDADTINMDWWRRAYDDPWESSLEVMYGEYVLGCGSDLLHAMGCRLRLAVDISHVEIQLQTGQMTPETWKALQDYPLISEIHVSESRNGKDLHQPITKNTPWLEWAHERHQSGIMLILEGYMHSLNKDQRREQLAITRGEV